jgi:hypothetical protein
MGDASETLAPASLAGNVGRPSQNLTAFSLDEPTIDDVRPLRVAIIGSGLSGVLAGVLLPAKVPNIQLTIFEKNHEVVSPIKGHKVEFWLKTYAREVHG